MTNTGLFLVSELFHGLIDLVSSESALNRVLQEHRLTGVGVVTDSDFGHLNENAALEHVRSNRRQDTVEYSPASTSQSTAAVMPSIHTLSQHFIYASYRVSSFLVRPQLQSE